MKHFATFITVSFLIAEGIPDAAVIDHSDKIAYESRQEAVLIDTTCMLWTQKHEAIAYSPIVDAIQTANRGWYLTGQVYVHQAPGDFSFWVNDCVYDEYLLGKGLYPNSVAGTHAYVSFATQVDLMYGRMVAQYQIGGWFSSNWASPLDLGPGDLDVHKVIGKILPDGNILFIGVTYTDSIIYKTWDSTLTNPIASGILATGVNYWGFDINGGIAYVFYNDNWNSSIVYDTVIYYKTTTDGINWSTEQIWSLAFTPPYPNTDIKWRQMALTDDAQPRLVFDAIDYSDFSYPFYGKVYVSHTSGVPPVELTAALGDTETIYPTIACGGGEAVAIFNVPRNNLEDTLNWWDIHYCYSTDNGITWSEPNNLTEASSRRVGLQHIAKRIDILRNQFFYIYLTTWYENVDPLWVEWFGDGSLYYVFCGRAPIVGIHEEINIQPKQKLVIYPNPAKDVLYVNFASNEPPAVRLFNCLGQIVYSGTINNQCKINVSFLPRGVYFIDVIGLRKKIVLTK